MLLLLLSADNSDNSNLNFFGDRNYVENHSMTEWISVPSCIGAVAPKKIWGWKILIITLNLECMMFLSSFKIQSLCLVDIFLIINLNDRLAPVIKTFSSLVTFGFSTLIWIGLWKQSELAFNIFRSNIIKKCIPEQKLNICKKDEMNWPHSGPKISSVNFSILM